VENLAHSASFHSREKIAPSNPGIKHLAQRSFRRHRPAATIFGEQTRHKEIREMAFYELRQYKVRPGKMDAWVKIMEEEIIPFQISKGMVICGSFRGETDDSVYVWLRRFESETEREALYKAVYESDHWKDRIAPRVPDHLDRSAMVVTRIIPTAKSTMR
jgi:NIPSNAP